ncbi:MAG: hypothetical protein CSA82_01730 [Actinobacteria bacterium]|nr:MAG: hypothetical protein CSA82_01730 [Actinomycetota bacterium]
MTDNVSNIDFSADSGDFKAGYDELRRVVVGVRELADTTMSDARSSIVRAVDAQHEGKWGVEPAAQSFAEAYREGLTAVEANIMDLQNRARGFADLFDAFIHSAENTDEQVEAEMRFLDSCLSEGKQITPSIQEVVVEPDSLQPTEDKPETIPMTIEADK